MWNKKIIILACCISIVLTLYGVVIKGEPVVFAVCKITIAAATALMKLTERSYSDSLWDNQSDVEREEHGNLSIGGLLLIGWIVVIAYDIAA